MNKESISSGSGISSTRRMIPKIGVGDEGREKSTYERIRHADGWKRHEKGKDRHSHDNRETRVAGERHKYDLRSALPEESKITEDNRNKAKEEKGEQKGPSESKNRKPSVPSSGESASNGKSGRGHTGNDSGGNKAPPPEKSTPTRIESKSGQSKLSIDAMVPSYKQESRAPIFFQPRKIERIVRNQGVNIPTQKEEYNPPPKERSELPPPGKIPTSDQPNGTTKDIKTDTNEIKDSRSEQYSQLEKDLPCNPPESSENIGMTDAGDALNDVMGISESSWNPGFSDPFPGESHSTSDMSGAGFTDAFGAQGSTAWQSDNSDSFGSETSSAPVWDSSPVTEGSSSTGAVTDTSGESANVYGSLY